MRRLILTALVGVMSLTVATATTASAAPKSFPNCAALLKKYPKGIANSASMASATGAKLDPKLYAKNIKLDKDKDGVACWGAHD